MMRRFETWEDFLRSHATLAELALAGDHVAAQAALMAHLESTLTYVYPPAEAMP
jgi:DNA-binding GntR family transcriptional regulator